MIKRVVILGFCLIVLTSMVLAQSAQIEVSTLKDTFSAEENITLRISLFDNSNSPISTDVDVIFESAGKIRTIEKTLETNKLVDVSLGNDAPHGLWTIKTTFDENEATAVFTIEKEEKVKFELVGDELTITNVGNSRYEKTVQIAIGNSIGIKEPSLDIGESISFRLIAPEGNYNVRITDGVTTLTRGDVSLTGEVIGVLDSRLENRAPITGSRVNEENSSFLEQNSFAYLFVIGVVGAAILLAVERRYRKKAAQAY